MAAYVLLDKDLVVQNVIEWDGVASYTPPEGLTVEPYDGPVAIGKTIEQFNTEQAEQQKLIAAGTNAKVVGVGGLKSVD